jgi:hypothetical protein
MGTLTDNLLKLTEFPFSYSFIGLLALIFGQGGSFGDEEFFNRLGPLLILMGFVATTLAITDPIGALQRGFLRGTPPRIIRWWQNPPLVGLEEVVGKEKAPKIARQRMLKFAQKYVISQRIFGRYVFLIPPKVTVSLSRNFQVILVGSHLEKELLDKVKKAISEINEEADQNLKSIKYVETDLNLISAEDFDKVGFVNEKTKSLITLWKKLLESDWSLGDELFTNLYSLQNRTLRTTWMVREIDKINALAYFIIVIFTFILAEILIPGFLDVHFLKIFQGANQTESMGQNSTATAGEAANNNTTVTNAMSTTIPAGGAGGVNQSLVKQHIEQSITALENNDTQGAMMQVKLALNATTGTIGTSSTTLWDVLWGPSTAIKIIFYFSLIALLVVIYMLYKRLMELRSKAWTIFRFLLELEAIKKDKTTFDKNLQAIEQYLNNGDWTMAEYWVKRTMFEYDDFITDSITRKIKIRKAMISEAKVLTKLLTDYCSLIPNTVPPLAFQSLCN